MGLLNGTVMIDQVIPGSGAERDGLKAGDRLLGVNGTPFGDNPLALLDPRLSTGAAIRFKIERDGEHLEIEVKQNPR